MKTVSLGIILILFSLTIAGLTFYPMFIAELGYQTRTLVSQYPQDINPISSDFGIVVPKIGANSRIIANVDPINEKEYQWSLTQGIAHAKGTAFPGQNGNVFLFSHSAANFYEASRFNAIFYLLSKLDKNDEVDLYYKGEKFKYRVSDKKIVDPKDVQYLRGDFNRHTVTLMTCTPPGTSLKRLLVIGELGK